MGLSTEREKIIKGIQECDLNGGLIGNCPYKGILQLLKEQEKKKFFVDSDGKITPLPDVVWCKDCKKHDTYDCHITYLTTQKTPNDWFCADGEREAEEK